MTCIARTTLDCSTGYVTDVRAGRHRVTVDEPPSNGGTDQGFAPYEMLLGSLGACTAITLRMVAERKGWSLGTIHVELELDKENDQSTGTITRVITFSETLTDEQRAKLAAIVEKTPVTRTIKAGAPITTRFT